MLSAESDCTSRCSVEDCRLGRFETPQDLDEVLRFAESLRPFSRQSLEFVSPSSMSIFARNGRMAAVGSRRIALLGEVQMSAQSNLDIQSTGRRSKDGRLVTVEGS